MTTPTGTDKAAMLLNCLPPEVVEKILARLGPEASERARRRWQVLAQETIEPAAMKTLVREVELRLQQAKATRGESAAPQVALHQSGEEAPPLPSEEVTSEGAAAALAALSPEVLLGVLHGEQAHTVALVLNSLPGDRAGEVLQGLPAEMRKEVPVRLSRLGSTSPDLLARIARALLRKARAPGGAAGPPGSAARYEKIASMLRVLEKTERMEALAALQEFEPDAALRVKELLYQFEDLMRIQDRSMQKLLAEIDSKSLAQALKGASEEINEKVLNNLSKRARESLLEEMEYLGMVPIAQVRQAQKTVVDIIQRLDQAGELQMNDE